MPADDGSAAWYARCIVRAAARTGIECRIYRLTELASRAQMTDKLSELSGDAAVHGIICQAPLPDGFDLAADGSVIPVGKAIEGTSPVPRGMLAVGVPGAFRWPWPQP